MGRLRRPHRPDGHPDRLAGRSHGRPFDQFQPGILPGGRQPELALHRRLDHPDQPVHRPAGGHERQSDVAAGLVGALGHRRLDDALLGLPAHLLPEQLHHHDGAARAEVRLRAPPGDDLGAVPAGQRLHLPADHALHGLTLPEDHVRARRAPLGHRCGHGDPGHRLCDRRRAQGRGRLRHLGGGRGAGDGSPGGLPVAEGHQFRSFGHTTRAPEHDWRPGQSHSLADPPDRDDLHPDVLLEHQPDHHTEGHGRSQP